MSRYTKIVMVPKSYGEGTQEEERLIISKVVLDVVVFCAVVLALIMGGCPHYNVWQQKLVGQAALERATQDRQITIQEASAKKESATMLAAAEVERAKGVAEANRIIGDSLKDNEGYLRYLWIDGLHSDGKAQVIYVPTEAGLPILEAGKRPHITELQP